MSLTVVGLGPGAPELLTVEAAKTLSSAPALYIRTAHHPVVGQLRTSVSPTFFDYAYDTGETFDQVYEEIAGRLGAASANDEVVYAVPGHPLFGEASTRLLLQRGLVYRVVAGLSFVEPACAALGIDPIDSALQLADSLALPEVSPSRPLLVGQVFSRRAASELKLSALRYYPGEHEVSVLHDLSLPEERLRSTPLSALDHDDDFNHLTAVFIPSLVPEQDVRTFSGLRRIVARLRSPEGCPWDREQTHESLKSDLLEECYEVLAALDGDDSHHVAEELGDLLNQVMLHTQIASEAGHFELEDVIEAIASKLVRRHPHVFAGLEVAGTGEVLRNWEAIKAAEDLQGEESPTLERVPRTLPALHQASLLLERAARTGFRWPEIGDVLAKLAEEVAELESAQSARERSEELGDILINLVNAGRHLGIDAEESLRRANEKFRARYAALERIVADESLDLQKMRLEQLLDLWTRAKQQTRLPSTPDD
jgi:tetrapyrrole methylase family protein / MazG family protein